MSPTQIKEITINCVQQTSNDVKQKFFFIHCKNKAVRFQAYSQLVPSAPRRLFFPPHQTCWKMHLMLQFQNCDRQSFTQLSSGQLSRNGEISHSGDSVAHGYGHTWLAVFTFRTAAAGGYYGLEPRTAVLRSIVS